MGESEAAKPQDDQSHTRALARGTLVAAVGRFTRLVEPLALLVFARLYGAEALGLYVLLMAYVVGLGRAAALAMPKTLQRFVPTHEADANAIVRASILVSLGAAVVVALVITAVAPVVSGLIRIGPESGEGVVGAIRLASWLVPLRVLMRVPLNAVRAKQQFGPEIYVRTLLEPLAWLVAGALFSLADPGVHGLIVARLVSFSIADAFTLRILARRFDLAKLLRPGPVERATLWSDLWRFSAVSVVYDVVHYLEGRLDVLMLGLLLTGPSGSAAVGAYGVARALSGAVITGRKSVDYAVGPIASQLHGRQEIGRLQESFSAATRWNLFTFIPIIATVLTLRADLLGLFGAEFVVASWAIVFLCIGRAIDELTGPTALVLAMVGRPQVPLANSSVAVVVSAALLWLLVPPFGITGAAIAAATGFAVANLAALAEIRILLGLKPYDGRSLRTLSFSCGAVVVLLAAQWVVAQTSFAGVHGRFTVTALWGAAFVLGYLGYGLPREDRELAREGLGQLRARTRRKAVETE